MQSRQLRRRWLAACILAGLLANWAGGLSVVVTAVFVVIALTGFLLLGQSETVGQAVAGGEPPDEDAEPRPDEDVPDPETEEGLEQTGR